MATPAMDFHQYSSLKRGSPLPILVKPLQSDSDWTEARGLRFLAYSRAGMYQEGFLRSLYLEDTRDKAVGTVVLGARCKQSRQLLGTVRLVSSRDVPDVLPSFVPKSGITQAPFTFIDRFAVQPGASPLVGPVLMKATWLWAKRASSLAVAALATRALTRHYARWGGLTLQGDGTPLTVVEHLREPVYFVGATLPQIDANLAARNPGFYEFLRIGHADIRLSSPGEPTAPRDPSVRLLAQEKRSQELALLRP